MKFTGIVAAATLASGAVADYAWTTTTTSSTTTTTTTSASSIAWPEWDPTSSTTTTTTTSTSTWGDWNTTTTTSAPVSATPTSTDSAWADWSASYVTSVVTAVTTYVPSATEIVHGDKTWTVSAATTLTITDCPCTLTYPVWTSTTTSCSATPVAANSTVSPAWSYSPTTSALPVYTGAASAQKVGGALAGVVGIAAMLL